MGHGLGRVAGAKPDPAMALCGSCSGLVGSSPCGETPGLVEQPREVALTWRGSRLVFRLLKAHQK